MKSLILLLVGLGLAAAILSDEQYRGNRVYEYDYLMQILSGQPETSRTTAGLLFQTKAKFLVRPDNRNLIIKFDNIRLDQLMKELGIRPSSEDFLPVEDFTTVPEETFETMKRDLSKPFMVKRRNGQIVELKTEASDPEYSVNIKKAFLYSINLDLVKISGPQNSATYPQDDEPQPSLVNSKERTFFGDCEPLHISPFSERIGGPVRKVLKIVDPLKCEDRPIHMALQSQPILCQECDEDQRDAIKSTLEYAYDFIPTNDDFFLKKVEIKSVHVLVPMAQQHGTIVQYIRGQLAYRRQYEYDASQLPAYDWVVRPEGLKMYLDEFDTDAPVVMERRLQTTLIKELEEQVVDYVKSKVEEKPKKMLKLVKLLKKASVADLKLLLENLFLHDSIPRDRLTELQKLIKREFVVGLLPFVSTQESFVVLKYLISAYRPPHPDHPEPQYTLLDHSDVKEILTLLSMGAKPTKLVVDQLHEITKFHHVASDEKLTEVAQLAYANVLKKLLVDPIKVRELQMSLSESNDIAFISKHLQIISKLFTDASTEKDLLLAVKVLSIVPLPEHLNKALSIARNPRLPIILRVEAAKALDLHATLTPRKVIHSALRDLMDPSLPTEVRVVLFRAVMYARPGVVTLQLIGRWLLEEPNTHVKSYGFSYLIGVSKSKLPCVRDWARKVRAMLNSLRPEPESEMSGIQYSRAFLKSYYSDTIRKAFYGEASYVTTPSSIFPRLLHAKSNFYFLGRHTSLFEVTAHIHGVEKLAAKMFGPSGSYQNSDSFLDMIRRKQRSSNNREERIANPPTIAIFTKFFDTEMPFQTVDKMFMNNMMKDGRIHVNDIDDYLREGFPVNFKKTVVVENMDRVLGTAAGLPVRVKYASVISVKHEGRAKMVVEPRLFRTERNRQVPEEVKVELESKPKVAFYEKIAVDLEVPVLKIGSKAQFEAKINEAFKVKLIAKPQENKFTVEKDQQYPQPKEFLKAELKPENVLVILPKPLEELNTLKPAEGLFLRKEIFPDPSKLVEHRFHYILPKDGSPVLPFFLRKIEIAGKRYKNLDTSDPLNNLLPPFQGPAFVLVRPVEIVPPEKLILRGQILNVQPNSEQDDWRYIRRVSSGQQSYKKAQFTLSTKSQGSEKELLKKTIYARYNRDQNKAIAEVQLRVRKSNDAQQEISIIGEANLPELSESYTRPRPYDSTPSLKVKISFGANNQERPAIKIQASLRKSQEQLSNEEEHTSWPEYQNCMREEEEERREHPTCERLMNAYAMRKRVHIVIETDRNQIPRDLLEERDEDGDQGEWPWQNVIRRLVEKSLLGREVDEDDCPFQNLFDLSKPAEQRVEIDFTLLNGQAARISVKSAGQEPRTIHIRRPFSLPPVNLRTSLYDQFTRHVTNNRIPAVCLITRDLLRTYDGRRYDIGHIDAQEDVLMTRHCAEPLFKIVLRPISEGREKIVIISAQNLNIEIHPDPGYESPVAVVNNVRYPMNNYNELRFPEDTSLPVKARIQKAEGGFVKIDLVDVGMHVTTNTIIVKARSSPINYGHLCGLCGNFDGIIQNDNLLPNGLPSSDDETFLNSYSTEQYDELVRQQKPPMMTEGQQRPPTVGQQRPPTVGQQRPPTVGQQRPPTLGQQRPPTVGQQRPPSSILRQQRPPSSVLGQQKPPRMVGQRPPDRTVGQIEPPSSMERQQRPPSSMVGQIEPPSSMERQQQPPVHGSPRRSMFGW